MTLIRRLVLHLLPNGDGTQKPQYFICGKILANGSMKPIKLKEHLVSVHPQHVSDSLEVFQIKKARFEKAGTLPKLGFVPPQKPCLEASYTSSLPHC